MNVHSIVLGIVLLNIALAAAAVIQRDRSLFVAWAFSCLLSTILLFFTYPVLAVAKLVLLILMARHLIALYNTSINLDQNAELRLHDVASSLVRREAVVPTIQNFVQQYSNYESRTLLKHYPRTGWPRWRPGRRFRELPRLTRQRTIYAARRRACRRRGANSDRPLPV